MIKVVNLRHDSYTTYIGRAGKGQDGYFGNAHRVGYCSICETEHDRGEAVDAFRIDFWQRIATDPKYKHRVSSLSGKLGCFCAPCDCHGDVYVEYHQYLVIAKEILAELF